RELEGCRDEAMRAADPGQEGLARQLLAYVLHRGGDCAMAAREAEIALRLPPMYTFQRAVTLATLAAARLAPGPGGEALVAAREAMGPEDPPRVRALQEPFIRLVYVEALTAAGEHEAARAALALARARLLETAARIGDPALRRTFLE